MRCKTLKLDYVKPFSAKHSKLKLWAVNAHNTLWNNGAVGEATKTLWRNPNNEKK